jgi:hypothetical protein
LAQPEPFELGRVTFHGPEGDREWVAFLLTNDDEKPIGCEGWGATPVEALDDLRQHMRDEHPEEFGGIELTISAWEKPSTTGNTTCVPASSREPP